MFNRALDRTWFNTVCMVNGQPCPGVEGRSMEYMIRDACDAICLPRCTPGTQTTFTISHGVQCPKTKKPTEYVVGSAVIPCLPKLAERRPPRGSFLCRSPIPGVCSRFTSLFQLYEQKRRNRDIGLTGNTTDLIYAHLIKRRTMGGLYIRMVEDEQMWRDGDMLQIC